MNTFQTVNSQTICHIGKTAVPKSFPDSGRVRIGFVLQNKAGSWPIYLTCRGGYVARIRSANGKMYDRRLSAPEEIEWIDEILGLDGIRAESKARKAEERGSAVAKNRSHRPQKPNPKAEAIFQRAQEGMAELGKGRANYHELRKIIALEKWRKKRRPESK